MASDSPVKFDAYAAERLQMVETQLRQRGVNDERVLQAMAQIPRHEFVSEEYKSQAYADHPIPIGENQTVSQPLIVGISLQALGLKGSESVLEVGTGSGYQTALLAVLARNIYSIERLPLLAASAQSVLARLGIGNVSIVVGDGSRGLPEHAPFDAILVSAAAPTLPKSLFAQLSDAGRMVIPIGPPHTQELQLIRKSNGIPVIRSLEGCRFVPLIGSEGY